MNTTSYYAIILALAFTLVGSFTAVLPSVAAPSSTASLEQQLTQIEDKLEHNAGIDEEAIKSIAEILKKNPRNARAHFAAGRMFDRAGYKSLAEQEFKIVDELSPKQPEAVLELFLLKMQADDFAAAFQLYAYLSTRFPDDPSLALMRALILEGQGQLAEAEKLLAKAQAASTKRLGIATAVGDIRLRQHKPAEALALAKQDLARDPRYYRAIVLAGEASMQLGQFDQGANYLRRAFEMNPLEATFVNVYASNLYHVGRYSEALQPALIYLAQQTDQKTMNRAKLQVRALLTRIPREEVVNIIAMTDKRLDRTAWQGRLHLALGDVFDSLKWRDLAMEEYKKGIELMPLMGRPYYRLAKDMEKSNRYYEALALYQQAYKLEPSDNQVKLSYARFHERMSNRNNDVAWRLRDWLHQR